MVRCAILASVLWALVGVARGAGKPPVTVTRVDGATAPAGTIEFRGVAAGPFDPSLWNRGQLHLLPDSRHPILQPREGKYRNIYAPSVVQLSGGGWRLFYGGWDGVPTGNDRIYSAATRDFLTFDDRHTVIEHGAFQHVCNVTAVLRPEGGYGMLCTGFPDEKGLNKPVYFATADGKVWNGSPEPYAANQSDVISIDGYDKYTTADINGMNILLNERGTDRIYFCNFRDFGKVYRASRTDGNHWRFDGAVMDGALAVNDVKKFRVKGKDWYLMGLHMNGPAVYASLSDDGMKFPPARELFHHLDPADRYIVAVGWVVDGDQDKDGGRLLGVLYGAGAVGSLDQNRIFARWLQKRVVIETDNAHAEATRALGPDRQTINAAGNLKGRLAVYREDGTTLAGTSEEMGFDAGAVYQIKMPRQ